MRQGASLVTLMSRASYGGRKARSARRRLRAMATKRYRLLVLERDCVPEGGTSERSNDPVGG